MNRPSLSLRWSISNVYGVTVGAVDGVKTPSPDSVPISVTLINNNVGLTASNLGVPTGRTTFTSSVLPGS
jgi:hypothetical protein